MKLEAVVFLVVVLLCEDIFAQEKPTENQWAHVAVCRVACFTQLSVTPVNDDACINNEECYMCWHLCENLLRPDWVYICERGYQEFCTQGCKIACQVATETYNTNSKLARSSQYGLWVFGDTIDIRATHDRLTYTWQRPVMTSGDSEATAIVYSLFWKSQTTSEWTQLVMTTVLTADITGKHYLHNDLQLKLVATITDGVVTEKFLVYPPPGYKPPVDGDGSLPVGRRAMSAASPHSDEAVAVVITTTATAVDADSNLHQDQANVLTLQTSFSSSPVSAADKSLAMDVIVHQPDDGSRFVSATVSWEVEIMDDIEENQAVGREIDGNDDTKYIIQWRQLLCHVHTNVSRCAHSEITHQATIAAVERQRDVRVSFKLHMLTYDTKYWVQVTEVMKAGLKKDDLIFYTPQCHAGAPCSTSAGSSSLSFWSSAALPSPDLTTLHVSYAIPSTLTFLLFVAAVVMVALLLRYQRRLLAVMRTAASELRSRGSSFRSSVRSSVRRLSQRGQQSSNGSNSSRATTSATAGKTQGQEEATCQSEEATFIITPAPAQSPSSSVTVRLITDEEQATARGLLST